MSAEAVADSQRQRLLTAVIEVVASQGYEGTRVADIINAAGVSRKTFYEHFNEKEDCFLTAYDRELQRLQDVTSEAFVDGQPRTWPDQIRQGLRGLLAYLAANPAPARVLMVDVMGAGPKAVARRDAALRSFTYFVDAGRSGASQQEVPGRTALAVLGALNALMATEIVHGSADRLEDLTPDLVYLVCLPFLGPSRALAQRAKSASEG